MRVSAQTNYSAIEIQKNGSGYISFTYLIDTLIKEVAGCLQKSSDGEEHMYFLVAKIRISLCFDQGPGKEPPE